ncbi:major facilitator superfamily domain-containing protein [Piptocephalis cylindrospora]|uniref:Major facilitator superfamily domain-containing protein n=1 Tax=Piptocephalis cylindrospora TaxID=1907219 RepID=A0A4P9Y005_9FUNG|nr:major facilitator superfamily domain-containing protein [Piptocephalis cylindrospora]|eukprot:RKP12098.1 major facilitator superfamily domain-containing protein [Piptocephalis cylindrospora]
MSFYRSSLVQIIILGFLCFCCPGMFNALNGMGGGGKINDSTASIANTALYACFAIFGLMSGAVHNILGPRLSLLFGGLCYTIYVGSFLAYNHTETPAFNIAAGALLGIGAALLWTAQGAIMMAYPTERQKGRFIAIFWIIFNLGGVMGGFIPFALNFHTGIGEGAPATSGVSDATYIAFMTVMTFGALLSLLLLPPQLVSREDGSPVIIKQAPAWQHEAHRVLALFRDPTMLLLLPIFLSSNWFYSYQFNGVNGFVFNLRTRGLNNVIYWGAQMVGATILGRFLDTPNLRRAVRATYSLIAIALLFTAVWAGGLVFQLRYSRHDQPFNWDFTQSSRVSGPIILYSLYGLLDAALQTWCYWVMGASTNDTGRLALYAGFYKGIQSAGGALSWGIDWVGVDYPIQLIISWALFTLALPSAYLVAKRLTDTNITEGESNQATTTSTLSTSEKSKDFYT